jgi:hypothetical protein
LASKDPIVPEDSWWHGFALSPYNGFIIYMILM